MNGIFVTGTDTGVGKTITSALLVSALKKQNQKVKYFKPVQTGIDDDTETIKALTEVETISPVYKFSNPISPHRAASLENETIDLKKIRSTFDSLENDFIVVEGAGGLMVPLNEKENIRDLIKLLGLPLIIVASTRLGTINHTLLTLECARSKNISILGLVLVGPEDKGLADTFLKIGDVPILSQIPHFEISASEISKRCSEFFQ